MSTLVLGAATLFDMSSAKRGKSLSEAENERLRKVIREKLLPRYDNNQSLAGPAIGLTQGGISRILVGGGGSLATARRRGQRARDIRGRGHLAPGPACSATARARAPSNYEEHPKTPHKTRVAPETISVLIESC